MRKRLSRGQLSGYERFIQSERERVVRGAGHDVNQSLRMMATRVNLKKLWSDFRRNMKTALMGEGELFLTCLDPILALSGRAVPWRIIHGFPYVTVLFENCLSQMASVKTVDEAEALRQSVDIEVFCFLFESSQDGKKFSQALIRLSEGIRDSDDRFSGESHFRKRKASLIRLKKDAEVLKIDFEDLGSKIKSGLISLEGPEIELYVAALIERYQKWREDSVVSFPEEPTVLANSSALYAILEQEKVELDKVNNKLFDILKAIAVGVTLRGLLDVLNDHERSLIRQVLNGELETRTIRIEDVDAKVREMEGVNMQFLPFDYPRTIADLRTFYPRELLAVIWSYEEISDIAAFVNQRMQGVSQARCCLVS